MIHYHKNATKGRFKDFYSELERYVFIALSVIIIYLSSSNHKLVYPISSRIANISTNISNIVFSPFYFIGLTFREGKSVLDIKNKYEILKSENKALQLGLFEQKKMERENAELKILLKFNDISQYLIVTTKIIHHPNPIYNQKIIIEAGLNNGVNKHDVVVYEDKFIGRIIRANDNLSEVLLITDKKSHIPVISSINNEKGILRGTGKDNIFEVIFYNKNHNMVVGESFLTASDGGFIPEGMIIGNIIEIKKKFIVVKGKNNLANLNFVQVFTRDVVNH